MPPFPCAVNNAVMQRSLCQNTRADTCTDQQDGNIVNAFACPKPSLGKGHYLGAVVDKKGQFNLSLQHLNNRDVMPTPIGRKNRNTPALVNNTGKTNANTNDLA